MYVSNVLYQNGDLFFVSNHKIFVIEGVRGNSGELSESSDSSRLEESRGLRGLKDLRSRCIVSEFRNHRCLNAFSVDNHRFLAFICENDGAFDLYIYSFLTKEVKRMTYLKSVSNISGAFGNIFAFSSRHNSPFGLSELYYLSLSEILKKFTDSNCANDVLAFQHLNIGPVSKLIKLGNSDSSSDTNDMNDINHVDRNDRIHDDISEIESSLASITNENWTETSFVIERNGYGYRSWKGYRGGLIGEILYCSNGQCSVLKNEYFSQGLGNPQFISYSNKRIFFISEKDDMDCIDYHNSVEMQKGEQEGELTNKALDNIASKTDEEWQSNKLSDKNKPYGIEQRNIFSCDLNGDNVVQHTFHNDFSISSYSLGESLSEGSSEGAEGLSENLSERLSEREIFYTCGGDIYFLSKEGVSQKIVFDHYDDISLVEKVVHSEKYIQDFCINDDGNELAVISRGKLFLLHPWLMGCDNFGNTNCRYTHSFIVNGKVIAVCSDGYKDFVEIYDDEDFKKPIVRFDYDFGNIYKMSISNDGCYAAILNHRNEILLLRIQNEKKHDGNGKSSDSKEENTQSDKSKNDLSKNDEIKNDESKNDDAKGDSEKIASRSYAHILKVGEVFLMDKGNNSEIDFSWSPNSQYIAYSIKKKQHSTDVMLLDLSKLSKHLLVSNDFINFCPRFCHSGDYLFFLSRNALNSHYGHVNFSMHFLNTCKPYAINLNKNCPSPFSIGDAFGDASSDTNDTNEMTVDLDGIENRILPFPVLDGEFYDILPFKDKVGFLVESDGKTILEVFDFTTLKSEEVISDLTHVAVSANGKWMAYLSKGVLKIAKGGEKAEASDSYKNNGIVNLSRMHFSVNLPSEYEFILREVIRLQVDFFWSKYVASHLKEIGNRYQSIVSKVSNRDELNDVIFEFHGELRCSHAYIVNSGDTLKSISNFGHLGASFEFEENVNVVLSSSGSSDNKSDNKFDNKFESDKKTNESSVKCQDEGKAESEDKLKNEVKNDNSNSSINIDELRSALKSSIMVSHASFEPRMSSIVRHNHNSSGNTKEITISGYKVTSILQSDLSLVSPLLHSDCGLSVGSYILSINGVPLTKSLSPEKFFSSYNQVANARVFSDGKFRDVLIHPIASNSQLLYRKWVNSKKEYVSQKTQNKIGYIHIPDMSTHGFSEFYRSYLNERFKDALIIDIRFNMGGNISTLLLEKLSQVKFGYDLSRWSDNADYPIESRPSKIIFLANEYTASDGDMFASAVKELKLGKVVGKRTWGGVVGIEVRFSLVDNGITSQPEHAYFYKSKIENVGVIPNVFVDYMPIDYYNLQDPQLNEACELIMNEL